MSEEGEKAKLQALAEQDAKLGPARTIAFHLAKVAIGMPVPTLDLFPEFAEICKLLKTKAEELGHPVLYNEGLRSARRQNELYAQGRTEAGPIVTNAHGLESYHQYGLAMDFRLSAGGLYVPEGNFWEQLGAYAKTLGCVWGGEWGDYAHFEYHPGFTWQDLKPHFE